MARVVFPSGHAHCFGSVSKFSEFLYLAVGGADRKTNIGCHNNCEC